MRFEATLMTIVDQNQTRRFEQIVGNSAALRSVLEQAGRVAATDATVLIQGETGTGKELIAHAIHNASPRSGHPFIKLNCAAIPFELLESELFGYERGAFTGAVSQNVGRFELADKGTLFLDEVGDIPLSLQPKLLRVLQEREFERLGSGRTHRVDVRVIAATHRNLERMVKCDQFRSDFYYRLSVFPITLPPLRERPEDIRALVEHYVHVFSRRIGKHIATIPEEFVNASRDYAWPGNIRELQNVIERAVILADKETLPNLLHPVRPPSSFNLPAREHFNETERIRILDALETTGWVIGGPDGAAARMGLKRTTMIARMKRHAISRPANASVDQLSSMDCQRKEINHA